MQPGARLRTQLCDDGSPSKCINGLSPLSPIYTEHANACNGGDEELPPDRCCRTFSISCFGFQRRSRRKAVAV